VRLLCNPNACYCAHKSCSLNWVKEERSCSCEHHESMWWEEGCSPHWIRYKLFIIHCNRFTCLPGSQKPFFPFKFRTEIYAYLIVSIFAACLFSHLKFHDPNIFGEENKLRKPCVGFISFFGTYTILGPHVLLIIRSSSTLCLFSSVAWLNLFSHQYGRTYNWTWKSLFPH